MTSKRCVMGGFDDFEFCDQPKKSQLVPNLIGGVSIASVIVACGWMVYSVALAAHGLTSSAKLDERFDFAAVESESAAHVFNSRFDAVYAGIRVDMAAVKQVVKKAATEQVAQATADGEDAEEALRKNYATLLDPSRSMGAPTTFMLASAPSKPERTVIAALSPEKSVQPLIVPPLNETARETAKETAKGTSSGAERIPVPAKRPPIVTRVARAASGPSRQDIAQAIRRANLDVADAKPTMFEKLFGKPQQAAGPMLAYAGPDGGLSLSAKNFAADTSPLYDDTTALYVITEKVVYMPDGSKLEAHSGLGPKKDDPKNVHVRMHGATPQHVYDLTARESLFHGVAAIRLTPIGGAESIHGRTGLLAHTYMLGPEGDSNGCVSFKDYDAFLQAFRAQKIKRLAVVTSL